MEHGVSAEYDPPFERKDLSTELAPCEDDGKVRVAHSSTVTRTA